MTLIMPRYLVCLLSILGLSVLAIGVRADEALEARMRDQLKEAVTQVRQLQIENASLKTELAKTATAPAVVATPQADPAELDAVKAALQEQTVRAAAFESQIGQAKKTLAQWQQSYEQAATLARARDADAKKFEALHRTVATHVDTCEKNNATLVLISDELLDRYKNKGVIESVRDREPILGLHRLQLERLAQEYHARIVDATVTPLAPEAQPAPTPSPQGAQQ